VKTIYNLLDIYKGMKLIDVINESEEDRLYKKGKAIYTALKRGKLNYGGGEGLEPARITYLLSDERDIFISKEGGIYITPKEIKVREENRRCMVMSLERLQDLIKDNFKRFGIALSFKNFKPREDWDTWLDREGPN
jgi:hypothetical protein